MSKKMKALSSLTLVFAGVSLISTNLFAQTDKTKAFTDVNADTSYLQAIQYLKSNNIVEGYADGSFKPESQINRAEFTKILIGSMVENPTGENCFPDVQADWFAPYICEAKKLGVVEGYADGSFKPAENINFAEAAKIISNTYNLAKDNQNTAEWYQQFVESLEKKQAIPLSINEFDQAINRGEMSEMIYRLKKTSTENASRTFQEIKGEGIVTVKSCPELDQRLAAYRVDGLGAGGGIDDMAMPTLAAPAPAKEQSAVSNDSSSDFSQTNVQVAGVDEADMVKNDGKYIYLVKGNSVRIVEAFPANNLKELSNIRLGDEKENFSPNELYVDGDRMVVIGHKYNYPSPVVPAEDTSDDSVDLAKSIMPPYFFSSTTKVFVLDIKDRNKVKIDRSFEFDGNYTSSRRVGTTLYLVSNHYSDLYEDYYNKTPKSAYDILPRFIDSKTGKRELLADCNQVYLFPKDSSYGINFVTTAAIPLEDLSQNVSRQVLGVGSSGEIYANAKNLYLTRQVWKGSTIIRPLNVNAENTTSTQFEDATITKLYRFGLTPHSIKFEAEGEVPGRLLNQFSMDEYENHFRIATTRTSSNWRADDSTNNLYVLNANLDLVGKVEDLAKGEQIYSVRFMGEKGYVVTFETVDPLFVFDLKDPKNPKLLGELKIPGFSDYLHPYDENHLIGFGRAADEGDVTQLTGFKMALFDVSNPNEPKELFSEEIGDQGTSSDLLYNHKALLFDKEKNLIAFPISETKMPEKEDLKCGDNTYSTCPTGCQKVCMPSVCTTENGVTTCTTDCDGSNSCRENRFVYPQTVFVGARVYGVDLAKGFELKGKISHLNAEEQAELNEKGYIDYEKYISRLLYIGENIYSVSLGRVQANKLSNAEVVKTIDLAEATYDYYQEY